MIMSMLKRNQSQSSSIEPLPSKALMAVLAAIVLTILPHSEHLPPWILIFGAVCLGWAFQIHRGRWNFPSLGVKTLLVVMIASSVALTFVGGLGLDSAVALFIAGLLLKPLELYNRRHAYVLIYLCYLLVGISFLYQQAILFFIYQTVTIIWILGAQVAINQGAKQSLLGSLYKASIIFMQAVPLMLILFVFVPRMGPFWSNPFSAREGQTGLSDEVTPGDIARLTKSDELVFRVEFEGTRPSQADLYWRGLILDQFDGQSWRQSIRENRVRWAPDRYWYGQEGEPIRYRVIQEATEKKWLFGLDWPVPLTPETGRTHDFRLVSGDKLMSQFSYQVDSYPQAIIDPEGLRPWEEKIYLALPYGTNPKARAWVESLQSKTSDTEALIKKLMLHFRKEPFYYSLTPNPLGKIDTIDRFLFDTRKGFCVHYAGAMVFALRSVGIPARMVSGYQGGEWNEKAQYLTVRQYDAHAWVEVWMPKKGWQRFDPTAMVAPERIEQSLEQAVGEEAFNEGRGLGLSNLNIGWIQELRFQFEALNYQWTRWVLSYNQDAQQDLFYNWFGTTDWLEVAKYFMSTLAFLMAVVILWIMKPWKRPYIPKHLRYFQRLEKWSKLNQVERLPSETLLQFGKRLSRSFPHKAATIETFMNVLVEIEYKNNGLMNDTHARKLSYCIKQICRNNK